MRTIRERSAAFRCSCCDMLRVIRIALIALLSSTCPAVFLSHVLENFFLELPLPACIVCSASAAR